MDDQRISPAGGQARFGPAGWSYADWAGTVYPQPKPEGFQPLAFIAGCFDFVEVNTTFYRIPDLRMTTGWVNQTRSFPNFRFWVKLPAEFSHGGGGDAALAATLLDRLGSVREAGKLSGLLAQFPYSFRPNNPARARLESLAGWFDGVPLAVEFRHRMWDYPGVLDFFRKRQLIWANIDQPAVADSLGATCHVTRPDVAYLRLHGRNRAAWFAGTGRDSRYDYLYSAVEIDDLAGRIRQLQAAARQVFVSGNNHYKGSAIRNLQDLQRQLTRETAR